MNRYCALFSLFVTFSCSQIAFPEEAVGTVNKNKDGRQPVYVPGLCPPNELYWPGDQETDWVCDCSYGFVYLPRTESCHEVYRQGPCKDGEYIILKKGKIIPECVTNPCKNDTMVLFNGKCHRLYKTDACPVMDKVQSALEVNHTSLELQCLPRSTAVLNIIQVKNSCPPGSKRSANGQCREVVG